MGIIVCERVIARRGTLSVTPATGVCVAGVSLVTTVASRSLPKSCTVSFLHVTYSS